MEKENRFQTTLLFGMLLSGILFHSSSAQWSTNPLVNNAISTFNFYNKFVPVIVSDGAGGAIITWEDSRNDGSNFDIYAQRINASGVVLWTADGVAISTGPQDKRAPAIVSDGAGGAIITWKDSRTGFNLFDIYAQRIDSSGTVKWTTDGVAICTVAGVQEDQKIVSDGSGGAIITWEDQRSGSGAGYKIYAQRIDSNGSIHSGWTADGVAIRSNLSGSVNLPSILGDGSGGAIITWSDYRNLSNYDIYAQRITGAGDTLWTANGAPVCTFGTNQGRPLIVSDGSGGAIIEWTDNDINGGDLYAQRINSSGTKLWATNGVAICAAANIQQYSTIISDGSGGAIVTWRDARSGFGDIYAQRVNASGDTLWVANGAIICAATDEQYWPTIVSDGAGGAIITWHDNRAGTGAYDIYAQRINGSGVVQWTTDGAAVCTSGNMQGYPTVTTDGAGGAIITWYDYRAGSNSDIYASQINANGSLGAGPLPVELVSFAALSNQHIVELKWKTATEVNNYGFEIEKKRIKDELGSMKWEKIGFVEGSGTTNSPKEYSYSDKNVSSGKYSYRLMQIDRDGKFKYSQEVEVTIGSTPKEFALAQNYPNPFNPSTVISYQLPANSHVTLKVYDAIGREVATLVNEVKEAGSYSSRFDGAKLSSGIYFVRLQSGEKIQLEKMILLK